MNSIGAASSDEHREVDLTLARAEEGANAVADAMRVDTRMAWNILLFVKLQCEIVRNMYHKLSTQLLQKVNEIILSDTHVTSHDDSDII